MSAIPADCEQVAILFGGWVSEPASEGMINCLTLRWCAQLGIFISRCTPAVPLRNTSTAPPAARMLEAAQISSDDAELLLALVGTFGEVGAEIQLATPEPEGSFQAVLLNVTLPAFGGLD